MLYVKEGREGEKEREREERRKRKGGRAGRRKGVDKLCSYIGRLIQNCRNTRKYSANLKKAMVRQLNYLISRWCHTSIKV